MCCVFAFSGWCSGVAGWCTGSNQAFSPIYHFKSPDQMFLRITFSPSYDPKYVQNTLKNYFKIVSVLPPALSLSLFPIASFLLLSASLRATRLLTQWSKLRTSAPVDFQSFLNRLENFWVRTFKLRIVCSQE